MARKQKIYISSQPQDREKARDLNRLRWNKNLEIQCVGRHLLDIVEDVEEEIIQSRLEEMIDNSSITVILIGQDTCDSESVQWEIEQSLKKGNPNSILAIRLDDTKLPEGCPIDNALKEAGAEIIDWDVHSLGPAIERAALAARRAKAFICGTISRGSCGR